MTFVVREVDVERERSRLVEMLARNLDDWNDEALFEWLYLENPWGRARSWVIEDGGRIEGMASAFPRQMRCRGRVLDAWVLGDFCVSPARRSLGPALMLQRAVNDAVARGDVEAWYDFPSRRMMAIHRRLGVQQAGEMVRMVYPLKVDRVVRRIGNGAVARGLSKLGNAVLSVRTAGLPRSPSVEVTSESLDTVIPVRTDPETVGGVTMNHTNRYIQWRYGTDPRTGAEMLKGSQDGGETARIVHRIDGGESRILDVIGSFANEDLMQELTVEVIDIARGTGAASVTASVSDHHPVLGVLEQTGFHRRDSVPFVVYSRPGALPTGMPWFLMSGDRDQ